MPQPTGDEKIPQAIAFIRAESRESLRATVLRWSTPRVVPRWSSGCAKTNSAWAAALFPDPIADSTRLMKVRIRPTRLVLTSARRALLRIRFLAEM